MRTYRLRRTSWPVILAMLLAAASCGGPSPLATAPTTPALAESRDPKDLAEALLLGSGPLANPGDAPATMVYGWESGSEIRVRASTQLPASSVAMIEQVVGRIAEATLGHVRATLEFTTDVDPRPSIGEITLWPAASPSAAGCPAGAALCALNLPFKA